MATMVVVEEQEGRRGAGSVEEWSLEFSEAGYQGMPACCPAPSASKQL